MLEPETFPPLGITCGGHLGRDKDGQLVAWVFLEFCRLGCGYIAIPISTENARHVGMKIIEAADEADALLAKFDSPAKKRKK